MSIKFNQMLRLNNCFHHTNADIHIKQPLSNEIFGDCCRNMFVGQMPFFPTVS